jgi:hypothetical protein
MFSLSTFFGCLLSLVCFFGFVFWFLVFLGLAGVKLGAGLVVVVFRSSRLSAVGSSDLG